jgi:hypothetical protein
MYIIKDAFFDTVSLVPFLAATYLAIGLLEYRYGDRMNHFIVRVGTLGPLAGALVGCIPQCGFSVIASALYVKRLISVGTLLSVFISTSDEAIPVLLSIPGREDMVLLLIAMKILIAVLAGMAVDAVVRITAKAGSDNGRSGIDTYDDAIGGHPGCCSHGLSGQKAEFKTLFIHPLVHTFKIFIFLFILAAIFNFVVTGVGMTKISSLLLRGSVMQPMLASLIGLIPNCFASVLLAGLFTKGLISFGSMFAGLCAGSGLGLIVLIKENNDLADTARVVGLLLLISVSAGVAMQFAF